MFPTGTQPEKIVRRLLTDYGYTYRLHKTNLPGKPDIVFEQFKKIIFVHGCFWHRHACTNSSIPKKNRNNWEKRLKDNQERDLLNCIKLALLGYDICIIWECETRPDNYLRLERKLITYMGSNEAFDSIRSKRIIKKKREVGN